MTKKLKKSNYPFSIFAREFRELMIKYDMCFYIEDNKIKISTTKDDISTTYTLTNYHVSYDSIEYFVKGSISEGNI